MLTKKRMLEMIDVIEGDNTLEERKKFVSEITNEEKIFLTKVRTMNFNKQKVDLTIRANLENYCYELSLDKVIDDRNKKIDEILNKI